MPKSRLLIVGAVAAAIGILPIAVAKTASRGDQNNGKLSASDLALIGGVIELVQHDYVHPVGSGELTKDALKGMLNRLEAVVRAFDPCLSCSTHALGQMALQVELVAPDGTLLDTLGRN